MEKEQVAVDEAVETVAEQNTRAYSKTVWNESTPITADKLNKIEDGIANALDTTTGGTVKGKLTVKGNIQSDGGNFYSNKNGGNKAVIEVFSGDKNGSGVVYSAGGLTVLAGGESGSLVVQNTNNTDEHAVVSADQGVILYANLQNGWENRKTVELTKGGRFKLNNNALELSPNNSGYARIGIDGDSQDVFISNINNNWFRLKGDKTITYGGHKVYTAFDKPTPAEIGALPLTGGTLTGALGINGGKLTFSNQIGGGQMSSLINCQELQNKTGNGQMMTAYNNTIYVGNPNTQLYLESLNNPILVRNGTNFTLYHTGNKPTANDVGALPIGGGTLTGVLSVSGNSKSISMGTGGSDVFISNSRSGKYLQLKDDGTLSYDDKKIYHEGNKPTPGAIGAMSSSHPTFEGNLHQNGPGGKDWIYHINAERGTLNIAPKNNGNPDWGKQIMFDRNGQMYCNGNRRVATINQENPAHHIIRYGAGMGGENGYITFSW